MKEYLHSWNPPPPLLMKRGVEFSKFSHDGKVGGVQNGLMKGEGMVGKKGVMMN